MFGWLTEVKKIYFEPYNINSKRDDGEGMIMVFFSN